jgi:cell division protein FtsW (lipid II flippase)
LNESVSNYIDDILRQVKYKKIHKAISNEIESHIEELIEGYKSEGMSEGESANKAILQMGNAEEIGKRLHNIHRPKMEWSIVIFAALIVAFGLYAMFSYSDAYSSADLFYKQLLFAGVGILALVFCCFFDYTKLEKYSLYIYLGVTLLLSLSILFGFRINGRAHIRILVFDLDPAAASIPFLIISFAGIVNRWFDGRTDGMFKLLALSSLPVLLCLSQPSFINAFITGAGFITVLTFSIFDKAPSSKRRNLLFALYGSISGMLIILFVSFIANIPYRIKRLSIFLNPESDPNGAGYLYVVLKKLLSSSSPLGSSRSGAAFNLPGGNSEFIFTFIVSSFGWIFGALLAFLLTMFIIRLFYTANSINDNYGKYLSFGICCVFSLQVVINILMNIGILPLMGISLPLISYGGTNFVINMSLIGILLGIYRRKDIIINCSKQI